MTTNKPKRPTTAQRAVLDAAAYGHLYRSESIRSLYKPFTRGGVRVRSTTVEACYRAGWLQLNFAARTGFQTPYVLTDAGRAALEG